MNEEDLRDELTKKFNPDPIVLDKVVTQAVRLDQSQRFETDFEKELTNELVVGKLDQADRPIDEGWNWWMGSLNFFENGYDPYKI